MSRRSSRTTGRIDGRKYRQFIGRAFVLNELSFICNTNKNKWNNANTQLAGGMKAQGVKGLPLKSYDYSFRGSIYIFVLNLIHERDRN